MFSVAFHSVYLVSLSALFAHAISFHAVYMMDTRVFRICHNVILYCIRWHPLFLNWGGGREKGKKELYTTWVVFLSLYSSSSDDQLSPNFHRLDIFCIHLCMCMLGYTKCGYRSLTISTSTVWYPASVLSWLVLSPINVARKLPVTQHVTFSNPMAQYSKSQSWLCVVVPPQSKLPPSKCTPLFEEWRTFQYKPLSHKSNLARVPC